MKYTLNPFTKIRSKIEPPCKDFDKGVNAAILAYNKSVLARTTNSSNNSTNPTTGDNGDDEVDATTESKPEV